MIKLQDVAFSSYSSKRALEIFRMYQNGDPVVMEEDVVFAFLPLCGIILKRNTLGIPRDAFEDIIGWVCEELLLEIRRNKNKLRVLTTSYFFMVIYHKICRCLRKVRPSGIGTYPGDYPPFLSQVTGPSDIIYKTLLSELPSLIRDRVLSNTRFIGNEYQVCRYIMNRILMGEEPISHAMETRYRIDPRLHTFFTNYVTIRIRIVLQWLKKDIGLDDLIHMFKQSGKKYYFEELVVDGRHSHD